MTGSMRWQIIVPSHNEGRELEGTVDSVIAEADDFSGDVRVFVADDLSDDYSGLDCAAAFDSNPRVSVRTAPRRMGCCHVKRWGYDQATEAWPESDMVMFLDAHSRLEPGFFAAASEAVNFHGRETLYTPHTLPLAEDGSAGEGVTFDNDASLNYHWCYVRNTARPYPVLIAPGNGQIFPRGLYDALGGFDEGLRGIWGLEDTEISLRTWLSGYEVRALPTAKVRTLFRSDNPHGGHRLADYYYNLARVAFGLLDPPHVRAVLSQYQASDELRAAIVRLFMDSETVGELAERRRGFKVGTVALFDRFSVNFTTS